jgi:glycosyltransferase involved in cell wall biosynthesis
MGDEQRGLVSVIIPAYNRVDYIEQAVASALAQSYPSVEVIVVDDGSTDGTYQLLEQRFGNAIRLMTHPGHENRGQSASINLGLAHAAGEYIAILDSDDYFSERKFSVLIPVLESKPEVGLVYSNGKAVDGHGRELYPIYGSAHVETNDPNTLLLDCYLLLPQNAVVRRSLYERAGNFEEHFRAAQDHDMVLRLAEITRMTYVPDYLFFYRRHAGSISQNGAERRWRNGFEILRRASQRYPYDRATIRKRRALLHFRLAQCHFKAGNYVRGGGRALCAAVLDPVRSCRVLTGREKKT